MACCLAERRAAALAHKKAHWEAYAPASYGFEQLEGRFAQNRREQETRKQSPRYSLEVGRLELKKIAEELNRRGVPTQQGSQWHVSTVRNLLQNSLYREVAQDGQTFDPGRGGGNSRR
ncbi:MAG: recombinase family protein [Limnochordaceae bacterium]|nr:recombinase family protein [Limnochordaceae bacterium]